MSRRAKKIALLVMSGGIAFQLGGCAGWAATSLIQNVGSAILLQLIGVLIQNATAGQTGG